MERVGRILRMHADHGEALEEAGPGDIVTLVGLKDTATGDTLCDRAAPILLEPPAFPEPVISLVVEPASSAERDKLAQALARMAREDPTFCLKEDSQTGQWTIQGMGELHLEVQLHRLEAEHGIQPRVGQPRVRYRESILEPGAGRAVVDKVLGGREVFGGLELRIEPQVEGPLVEWEEGVELPAPLKGAVEEALLAEAQVGPRFGYPLVGGCVRVLGVERHPERESEAGYAQAAVQALRQAMRAAESSLLEPQMAFEVQVPEDFSSGAIADLGSRKADIRDVVSQGEWCTIAGTVALAQMFGYSTAVRSLSRGRGSYTMTPAGYVPIPPEEWEPRGLA